MADTPPVKQETDKVIDAVPEITEEVVEEVVEEVKPGEEKTEKTEEEIAAEAAKVAEATAKTKEAEKEPDLVIENKELRQLMREMKREQTLLKAKVDRVDKAHTEGLELEDGEKAPTSTVEQLNASISAVGADRGGQLDLLLDMMSDMPKYEDVNEVCTREHFADIFEAIGQGIAERDSVSMDEAMLTAELNIWQMPNPYKYMYNTIKQYHPKYVEAEPEKSGTPKPGEKGEKGKKPKTPAEAPGSIAGMGGGDAGSGGWTSAKVLALTEDELHTVPHEVYIKYMAGELK